MADKEPKKWITVGGKHIPIFDDELEEDKKAKEEHAFKDGDTPRVLDDNATYEVTKISLDDSKDANYGTMNGADAKLIIKGCKYEEIVPGDGMWYKSGVSNYAYDIKRK